MKSAISTILGLILFCAVIFGMYWVFKTVSYTLFYDAMVQETVREMVKSEYLK